MSSTRVTSLCLALGLLMAGNAYSAVEPVSWLLEQVRVGEATHNRGADQQFALLPLSG